MDIELLEKRARIIREIRSFFDQKGYLEVDTPLLVPDLIPESCLEVFETAFIPPRGSGRETQKLWLAPSPEIWMKKIIARHRTNVYQICKCFRNCESAGKIHSPEFTMLEYYTMDAGYLDSLVLTEELFRHTETRAGGAGTGLWAPFLRVTVEEAFARWAGFSLAETAARGPGAMTEAGRRLGLDPPPGMDVAALYDLIFIHAVEPNLPKDRAVALMDYPAFIPCLARDNAESPTKQRWELYINGIELANCYSEETDPEKVWFFFESEGAKKEKNALIRHKINTDYWKIFGKKPLSKGNSLFPVCSGVAMGLDRLIMVLTGRTSIDSVIPP